MSKGYSVVKLNDKVIKSINEVNIDDKIDILVNDGVINANVINKRKDEK